MHDALSHPTPAGRGFFMPAEWETHSATWLAWPKNAVTFPEGVLEPVEKIYGRMIEALSPGEIVNVVVESAAVSSRVRSLLGPNTTHENVHFWPIPNVDVWIRDWGPTFLLHRQSLRKACVKWRFNAWGNKYADLLADDVAGDRVAEISGAPVFRPGLVMEGGSYDVNGEGALLTTEQCLLNPNRNPHLDRAGIEEALRQNLGVLRVVWLAEGIAGDDTDGHVDDFARFVSPRQVACSLSEDPADPDHAVLMANYQRLEEMLGAEGFDIIPLPAPKPIIDPVDGRRLPASYANFYIGNFAVLLPVFDDPADERAVRTLEALFPTREVVPVSAAPLIYGYGGIHCVTQQEPLGEGPA